MNKSALPGFTASIFLAAALTACSGGADTAAGSPEAASSPAASAGSSQSPSPTGTPTPDETPAKSYSSDELATLVGQIKDARGVPLTVMPAAGLAASVEQAKKLLADVVVEPAQCQDLVLAANSAGTEGLSSALGTSVDSAAGAAAGVSFATGTGPDVPAVRSDSLAACKSVTVTTAGVTVSVVTSPVEGVGSQAGTVAYVTETTLPDGRKQSMLIAQARKNGVAVSVSGNGISEEDAITRVGGLVDQALAVLD
ncbi:hypothetical protein [Arthrobacter sp. BE255]|uniref:hypothetical protein n=1 Tax=Arthrobacter sp. BE255 TaxID=2817721 RepID=UPI002858F3BC|nr:hypothetical protein [Arthrobacter sp. BE255]MDR7160265.1 hypothetical protein [Arthrobacter sp. BE255]